MKRPATAEEIRFIGNNPELGDRTLSKRLGLQLSVVRLHLKRMLFKFNTPKPINKPKRKIKQVSDKMKGKLALYKAAKEEHLKSFPVCQVCGNDNISIHHIAGRSGSLLYDKDNFITLCMGDSYHLSDKYPESNKTDGCHPWVERNLKLAKEIGLAKSKHQINE